MPDDGPDGDRRGDCGANVAGTTRFGIWTARYDGARMEIGANGDDLVGSASQAGPIKDDGQHVVVGDYGGPGWKLDGDIAEIVIYDHALSVSDRAVVERYLGAKYGLRLARNPRSVRGLRMWLDANQFAGLGDGAPVAAWPDQSGLGSDATQSDATRRPTFRANAVNGRPAVRFDGVDDVLDAGELGLYTEGQTVFVVARTNAAQNQVLVGQHAGALNGSWYFAETSGGLRYTIINSADVRVDNDVPEQAAGDFGVWVARYDGSALRIFANGMPVGRPAEQSGAIKDDNRHVYVGSYAGPGWTFSGDIAEVLVYDRALGTTERLAIEAYLARHCGIELQRPYRKAFDEMRPKCRGRRQAPKRSQCRPSVQN